MYWVITRKVLFNGDTGRGAGEGGVKIWWGSQQGILFSGGGMTKFLEGRTTFWKPCLKYLEKIAIVNVLHSEMQQFC